MIMKNKEQFDLNRINVPTQMQNVTQETIFLLSLSRILASDTKTQINIALMSCCTKQG